MQHVRRKMSDETAKNYQKNKMFDKYVSWLQWIVFDDWVTKINEDLKNFPSDIKNSKIRQYLQSSILKNGRKLKLVYKHKQVK